MSTTTTSSSHELPAASPTTGGPDTSRSPPVTPRFIVPPPRPLHLKTSPETPPLSSVALIRPSGPASTPRVAAYHNLKRIPTGLLTPPERTASLVHLEARFQAHGLASSTHYPGPPTMAHGPRSTTPTGSPTGYLVSPPAERRHEMSYLHHSRIDGCETVIRSPTWPDAMSPPASSSVYAATFSDSVISVSSDSSLPSSPITCTSSRWGQQHGLLGLHHGRRTVRTLEHGTCMLTARSWSTVGRLHLDAERYLPDAVGNGAVEIGMKNDGQVQPRRRPRSSSVPSYFAVDLPKTPSSSATPTEPLIDDSAVSVVKHAEPCSSLYSSFASTSSNYPTKAAPKACDFVVDGPVDSVEEDQEDIGAVEEYLRQTREPPTSFSCSLLAGGDEKSVPEDIPSTIYRLLDPYKLPDVYIENQYGAFCKVMARLLGCTADCYPTLALWKPAIRCYNIVIPRFVNAPFNDLGIDGLGPKLRRIVYMNTALQYRCNYCTAHTTGMGDAFRGPWKSQVDKMSDEKRAELERPLTSADDERCTPFESDVIRLVRAATCMPSEVTMEQKKKVWDMVGDKGLHIIGGFATMMAWLNAFMDTWGCDLEPYFEEWAFNQLGSEGWQPGKHRKPMQDPSSSARALRAKLIMSKIPRHPSLKGSTPGFWDIAAFGYDLQEGSEMSFGTFGTSQDAVESPPSALPGGRSNRTHPRTFGDVSSISRSQSIRQPSFSRRKSNGGNRFTRPTTETSTAISTCSSSAFHRKTYRRLYKPRTGALAVPIEILQTMYAIAQTKSIESKWLKGFPSSPSNLRAFLSAHFGFVPQYLDVLTDHPGAYRAMCLMMWNFLLRDQNIQEDTEFVDPILEDSPSEWSRKEKTLLWYVYATVTQNRLLAGHAAFLALRSGNDVSGMKACLKAVVAGKGERIVDVFPHADDPRKDFRLDAAVALIGAISHTPSTVSPDMSEAVVRTCETPAGVVELVSSLALFHALHRMSGIVSPEPPAFEHPVRQLARAWTGRQLGLDPDDAGVGPK